MHYQYSPVGDICTFIVCSTLFVAMISTYIPVIRRFKLAMCAIFNLCFACVMSILFNYVCLPRIGNINEVFIYMAHNSLYISLIVELGLFIYYIYDLIGYEQKMAKWFIAGLMFIFCVLELTSNITHIGFYIQDGKIHQVVITNIYLIWYVLFIIIMFVAIIKENKIIVNRIYGAIAFSFGAATTMIFVQFITKTETFTTITYLLPIIVVIFLFHSNSYNSTFGALSKTALEARMDELIRKKKQFCFVYFNIPNFFTIENLTQTLEDFKAFSKAVCYKDFLFRYNEDTFIMLFNDMSYCNNIKSLFQKLHAKYEMSHSIVIAKSNENCHNLDDYMTLCESVQTKDIYTVTDDDIIRFSRDKYLKEELEDIDKCQNLDDERVKVYCQPILNINSRKFTTAESLMRLDLPNMGLVFPDVFIPIAEANGNIHTLTLIILNKVCQYIETHNEIERISVNFSMYEIVKPGFFDDVIDIIMKYSFDKHKLGFEITESIEADDFDKIKDILTRFRSMGIKIYLDDFGTGYSNMEHIMKLPLDIIKFDRSLVESASLNKSFEFMVSSLSNMFSIIGYSLLYEGIEDESDQKRCISMKAEYLQGYRYSKPVPIESLKLYIGKTFED